eukprot:scaffold5566_cov145-Skeletonema_menzelii.AAC.1
MFVGVGDSRIVKDSQGHSRTFKDSQGQSRTLKDTQGHSRIVKDTQGQWYLSDITSTAFMRWILKTRPLVNLTHGTHTPHCNHTIGLTSSGVFQLPVDRFQISGDCISSRHARRRVVFCGHKSPFIANTPELTADLPHQILERLLFGHKHNT